MKQKKQKGFTLIELMIVVAIVAILAAVAIPFYADFVIRGKTSELAAALDACKTAEQEYRESENTYAAATTAGCSQITTQYMNDPVTEIGTPTATALVLEAEGDATEVNGCTLRLETANSGADWAGCWQGTNCEQGMVPPRFRAGC